MNSKVQSAPPVWKRGWLLGVLLIAGTLAAYWPALSGGFIWDDDRYVTQNALLSAPDGMRRIWFSLDSPSQYFPLTYTVFRLERALWGLNPLGYHGVNLLLHVGNALLLWRLLKRLGVPGAWLAAAIFALHPVEVESVAWVTELKSVLSLFFILLTVWCWVEFVEGTAKPFWYGLALLFYALALFSKSTACTLPAALLLVLWLKTKPIDWRRLVQVVPFLLMGLGLGLLAVWWEKYHQGTQGKLFSLSWLERILVASHALWFYAGKLFWPENLTFSYPRWAIEPADPLAYGWLAAGLGMGAVIYYVRRYVGRGLEVGVVFFAAMLSPLLGLIMLYTFRYSFVADHYQYVASIGLIALAAGGLTVVLRSGETKRQYLRPVLCGAWLLTLGVLTWRQCGMYRDVETLWRTTIARNPACWMAYNGLGLVLDKEGQVADATSQFQEAIRLKPDLAEAYNNLGNIFLKQGQLADAIDQYQEAIREKPDYAGAYNNLGNALLKAGRLDEAIAQLQAAIRLEPGYAEAYNSLGVVLDKRGQLDEAISQFQAAIRLKADYAEAYYNLGNVLSRKHQLDGAISQYQEALRLKANYAEAHNNLGFALGQKGRTGEAVVEFQEAVRLRPEYAEAHYNLGTALGREGRTGEAIGQYREAIRLRPEYAEAYDNLAKLLAGEGRLDEAVSCYRAEIGLKPGAVDAEGNLGNVLAAQGRYAEADREYEAVLRLVPNSAQGHLRYGQALAAEHRYGAAKGEYEKVLELHPGHREASERLAWLLATCPEASLRDGKEAVELAEGVRAPGGNESPQFLDTLGAAYAEAGEFEKAVETARRALELPATKGDPSLAEGIQTRLKLYEAKTPYHERP